MFRFVLYHKKRRNQKVTICLVVARLHVVKADPSDNVDSTHIYDHKGWAKTKKKLLRPRAGKGKGARAKEKEKEKGIRTPYVTVLPSPLRLCASWLLAGTELIIGTTCVAPGRGTFHSSQKVARAAATNPITLTNNNNNNKIIIAMIIIPVASRLSRVLRRADGTFVVVVAVITLTRTGSARRWRRMGPQMMASNVRPSGTRASRDHQAGVQVQVQVQVQEVRPSRIQIFGIPMAPLSSRSGRPSSSCTNRRCRNTRPTSRTRSGRRKVIIRAAATRLGRAFPSTG